MNSGAEGEMGTPPDLVEVGFLRGAYGLRGWSHVQAHSLDATVLQGSRRWWLLPTTAGDRVAEAVLPLEVTAVRLQGAALVAKWRGCDDPEAAQALRGRGIAVSRADFPALPEGQFYWVDLVDFAVVNRNDLLLGRVRELRSNGAHDLLVVNRDADDGSAVPELLIPMVDAYVDGIDREQRRIRVDWDPAW